MVQMKDKQEGPRQHYQHCSHIIPRPGEAQPGLVSPWSLPTACPQPREQEPPSLAEAAVCTQTMVGTRPRERWGSPKSSDSEARALCPRQHLQASPEHSQPASSGTGTGQGCVTTRVAPGDKPLVLYRSSGIHKQKAAGSSQTELLPRRNHHSEDNTEGRSTDGTLTFEQNKGASVPAQTV